MESLQPSDPELPGTWLPRTEDGRGISFYSIGQSISMLPGIVVGDLVSRVFPDRKEELRYLIPQFLLMTVQIPLCSALALLAFFLLARRLDLSPTISLWTTFAFGFGTSWLFYTFPGNRRSDTRER